MRVKNYRRQEFLPLMIEIVRLYEPEVYVELGVQRGNTLKVIAPFVRRAVGVDRVQLPVEFPSNVEFFEMEIDNFAKVWKDPIDLLFLDADHDEKKTLEHFDLFSSFVTEGTGLVLMHDTHPVKEELIVPGLCGTAWKAAWKIRTERQYQERFEIITLPGPWAGVSIIRKSKRQLCWRD